MYIVGTLSAFKIIDFIKFIYFINRCIYFILERKTA